MVKKIQYDAISDKYEESSAIETLRNYVLIPTINHMIGDIRGKRILDLACGTGLFSRLFKKMGAAEVVGVDISTEMIKQAEACEEKNPQGIRYRVGDVCDLKKIGNFDIIFASFCLHYAENKQALQKMCDVIALNLESNGLFISFNEDPSRPTHEGVQYDFSAYAKEEIKDGVKIFRGFYDNKGSLLLTIDHFHYEESTYFDALSSSGFCDIRWQPFIVGDDAPKRHDWSHFKNRNHSIAVLTCRRI